jgi:hypothetical protein
MLAVPKLLYYLSGEGGWVRVNFCRSNLIRELHKRMQRQPWSAFLLGLGSLGRQVTVHIMDVSSSPAETYALNFERRKLCPA